MSYGDMTRARALAQFGANLRKIDAVESIVLFVLVDDKTRETIAEWAKPFDEPSVLTTEANRAAEEYARDDGLAREFLLIAFDKDGAELAKKQWTVSARGGHYYGQNGTALAADATAMHVMERHAANNARGQAEAYRLVHASLETLVAHYKQIIDTQAARIAELEKRETEMHKIREELETKKHERTLDLAKAARNEEVMRELVGMFKTYAPLALTKKLRAPGHEGVFQGKEQLDAFLERFMADGKRFEAMMMGHPIQFKPDELVALMAIAQTRVAEHKEKTNGQNGAATHAPPAAETGAPKS